MCAGFLYGQANFLDVQFKKVGAVNIVADGPVDVEFLQNLIEITPNVDIVTTSKIRKSIELLYATGNFTNVLVDAVLVEDRVQLTFILKKVYRLRFIHLSGQLGVSGLKIRNKLPLRKFEPYTPERVLKGRDEILKVLAENGYYQASVRQDVLLHRLNKTAEVSYFIRAGSRAQVGTLVFTGTPHFSETQLLSQMKLRPGKPFKEPDFERDLERIAAFYDKNGFLEPRIHVAEKELDSENHMNLKIDVEAGKQLVMKTEGYTLSRKSLRENVPVWSEHSYNDDTLEEGRRNLTNFLQSKGYSMAKVSWQKEFAGEEIHVTYSIEKGPSYKIDRILISGNSHFLRNELLEIMQTKESGLIGASPYVTKVFESDLDRMTTAYREKGFLFAHFTRRDVIPDNKGKIRIQLEVDEGPQVTVSEIRISGNQVIPTEYLLQNFVQKIGRSISESKVKADSNYIVALYSDRGYPKIQLENRLLLSRDKTRAVIEYRITEGEEVTVDRVVFSGNYRTKRDVIEKNLLFREEDPFSLRKIIASQSKLYSLNIFDRVDTDIPRPDSLQRQQSVLLRFTESRPYTVSYGFGYQSFDRLRGIFLISNRNLFGTARTLSLQVKGGFKERGALLSYTDPHLIFHQVASNISGFAQHGVRPSYSFTRYGALFQVEKKLSRENLYLQVGEKPGPSKSLFFGYQFEDINTTGTPPLDPFNRQFLAIHISSVSSSFVRDARDNAIDPTRGNYLSSNLQYASTYLGSETDFLKSLSQIQYYLPVKRTVIATSFRLGLAKGFRETVELPFSQRFFAGGGRTIRGFEIDKAGPLDETTGQPTGGNALFIWNLENRFPLFGNVGGVIFFDYGTVFSLISDFQFSEMRKTAGLGIRYKTPIGPIAVDWGYKLDRRLEPFRESASEFFISVGHAF